MFSAMSVFVCKPDICSFAIKNKTVLLRDRNRHTVCPPPPPRPQGWPLVPKKVPKKLFFWKNKFLKNFPTFFSGLAPDQLPPPPVDRQTEHITFPSYYVCGRQQEYRLCVIKTGLVIFTDAIPEDAEGDVFTLFVSSRTGVWGRLGGRTRPHTPAKEDCSKTYSTHWRKINQFWLIHK